MGTGHKVLCIGIIIFFFTLFMAQTPESGNTYIPGGIHSLPGELLRPRHGEAPHFPRDYVIGSLGRCDASEEPYHYARILTAGLAAGNGKTEGVEFLEQKRLAVVQGILGLDVRSWRVGGGREEPDGSISFLIRFLGREKSIAGELYLKKDETGDNAVFWVVDDIQLEPPRGLTEGKYSPGAADIAAYERFSWVN